MQTMLLERKVEAAPFMVTLAADTEVELLLVCLGNADGIVAEVYQGTSGAEALDAFWHPFARPTTPDVFRQEVLNAD